MRSDDAFAPDPLGSEPVDPSAPGTEVPVLSRATSRWQGAAVALISGAILFGACQGDNLWNGNSETLQPKVVGIAMPSQVYPSDTVKVQVSAYGTRQISRVEIAVSGAATFDTAVTLTTPAVSVAQTFNLVLPSFLADTSLIIKAIAYDKVGAASRQRVDTAKAVAPPMVVSYAAPDSVRPGSPLRLAVRAVGVHPVTRIRVQLRGAVLKYDSIAVLQPRKDVSDTITFPISVSDVVDTTLIMDLQAVDNTGLAGYITRATVPVAIPAPTLVQVTAPDTARAGNAVDVSVDARGLRTITKLRLSLRGAVTRDSAVNVSVPGRTISQTVSFMVPADVQDSTLRVSVTAQDAAGIQSSAWQKTMTIPTAVPVVDNLTTPDSIRPGSLFDARVVAHGSRPLSRIDLSLRGAVEKDVFTNISPTRVSVTQDFSVQMPDSSRDSMMVVRAKATDMSGAVSAWYEKVLRVSDTAPPTVSAALVSNTVAAGRSVDVKVSARDNVGLAWVGARLYNALNVLLRSDSVAATSRSADVTISLTVPTGPAGSMSVIAFAKDRSNREGKSAALPLSVIDSSLPTATIIRPTSGQTVPLGDPITVTVQGASLAGVKSIDFSGVSIRGDSLTNPTVVTRYNPTTVTFPTPGASLMPRDTTITRILTARADTVSEYVRIIALVTDSAGKRSADTVQIAVGGPLVQVLTPANNGSVGVGQAFQLRVFAKDRSVGVDSVTAVFRGALNDSVKWGNLGAIDSVTKQADVTVASAGAVTIDATAWNHKQIVGRASTVTINAVSGGTSDQARPLVAVTSVQAPVRVELTQSISVAVRAQDVGTAGLVRFGIMGIIARPAGFTGTKVDTVALTTPAMAARSGWIDTVFTFTPRQFGLSERNLVLPANLALQVSAFAVDGGGYCGAGGTATPDSITCRAVTLSTAPGTWYLPQNGSNTAVNLTLVGGRSIALPDGGNIADAAVDNPHQRLYLSNIQANKVDILKLSDTTFVATGMSAGGAGMVGSQPWGLFLNGAGDTLFVGNSGSTNISFLVIDPLRADYLREDVGRRLLTPNEVLFEIKTSLSNGLYRYARAYYDFSDRPQYVAQDLRGRLVYSTVPTEAANTGTLRYVVPVTSLPSGHTPVLEPKLLFNSRAVTATENYTALAYLDDIVVLAGGATDDLVQLYDHVPNDTALKIVSPALPLAQAIAWMQSNGSDVEAYAGKWDIASIGMSDTTFMAASSDRGYIAFGEGGTAPTGRIMMWNGQTPLGQEKSAVSGEIAVQDLVNNASERVFGLGLNANGTLGVARGASGAYFFTPDLRLQGVFSTPGGAGGAAMDPVHLAAKDTANGLAFVSTPNKTIKILHAVHFYQRGEIGLRDNVVGPVKAALPLASENVGLAATDPNYILVKLYAVTGYTDADGQHTQVVIINVRNKDLTN